jgi:hypothetical protein
VRAFQRVGGLLVLAPRPGRGRERTHVVAGAQSAGCFAIVAWPRWASLWQSCSARTSVLAAARGGMAGVAGDLHVRASQR